MNGGFLLLLSAPEARAGRLLADFEHEHEGVDVFVPSYSDERWQAAISAGAVPHDPGAIWHLTADKPSELLAKLRDVFADSAPDRPG